MFTAKYLIFEVFLQGLSPVLSVPLTMVRGRTKENRRDGTVVISTDFHNSIFRSESLQLENEWVHTLRTTPFCSFQMLQKIGHSRKFAWLLGGVLTGSVCLTFLPRNRTVAYCELGLHSVALLLVVVVWLTVVDRVIMARLVRNFEWLLLVFCITKYTAAKCYFNSKMLEQDFVSGDYSSEIIWFASCVSAVSFDAFSLASRRLRCFCLFVIVANFIRMLVMGWFTIYYEIEICVLDLSCTGAAELWEGARLTGMIFTIKQFIVFLMYPNRLMLFKLLINHHTPNLIHNRATRSLSMPHAVLNQCLTDRDDGDGDSEGDGVCEQLRSSARAALLSQGRVEATEKNTISDTTVAIVVEDQVAIEVERHTATINVVSNTTVVLSS